MKSLRVVLGLRGKLGLAPVWGCVLLASGMARADQTFITAGVADWNTATNWNGGIVPTGEGATINNGATAQIGAAAPAINWMYVDGGSVVSVETNGSLRDNGNVDFSAAGGTVVVNGGGVLTVTGQRINGGTTVVHSAGTLNLGAVDDSSWGRVGNNFGPLTTLTIDGGTVDAQYTEGDGIVIGDYFTHTVVNIVTNGLLYMGGKRVCLGWWNGGLGEANMAGGTISFDGDQGSFWIGAGHDDAANPAKGYLWMGNGASVSKATIQTNNWGDFVVGTRWGGSADNNYGQLVMEAGSTLFWQRGAVIVGRDAVTTGVVTNNGGTITVPDAFMAVGQGGGNGTFVMNGGTLTHGNQDFYVGTDGGSVGTLVMNGGTLNHSANSRFVVGNNGGTGSMTVNGTGTVVTLSGNNEFQVGNNGGSTGTFTLNAGTVDTYGWTVASREGGNGQIIINGGTMNVHGNNGHLQVVAGSAVAGNTGIWDLNGGILSNAQGEITFCDWYGGNEAYATFNLNGGRLYAGNIHGGNVGALYHSVFNFNGGILHPTGGNILHDIEAAYVRTNGAIFEFLQNNTTLNQPLLDGGGGGGLVVRGTGVMIGDDDNMLVIPGTNSTFTGGLIVSNAAHVRIGNAANSGADGALGDPAGDIVLNWGGLKNNDSSDPVLNAGRTITLAPGGGYFTIGWGDRSFTVLGQVTGPGGLNVNPDGGHLVLSNPLNDYAGDTRIGSFGPGRWSGGNNAGLYLGASDVIPNGTGKGSLVIDGGHYGNLNLNGYNETVNGLVCTNSGRVWNSGGAATLTVGDSDASGTFGGTIENNVGLTKIGSGVLTITGVNSYTGLTSIVAGRVLLSSSQQPGLSQGKIAAGGMDTGTPNPKDEGVTLTTVAANTTAFPPWADATEWIYTGYINNPGTSSVTWTFGESVDDATWLKIDNTVLLNNGSWDLPTLATCTLSPGSHFFEVRFQNGAGGAGLVDNLWWQSGGTLGFGYDVQGRTDTNLPFFFTAITDPGDGTLFTTGPKYNMLPAASLLALNAGALLDLGGTHQQFAGLVDGGSGGGTISNGAASLSVLTIDAASGSNHVFGGSIVDGGGLVALRKTGAGQLTLTGTNTVGGGTAIAAGTLRLGDGAVKNGTLTGDITNDAALVFANASAQAYGGVISGSGSLSKAGGGVLALTGINSFSGTTAVLEGTLLVENTSGSGALSVAPGATVGGSGLVMGPATSDGTTAPGSSVGTLNFAQAFTQSTNGALAIEIAGPASSDRIYVLGPVALAGSLNVSLNAYAPAATDTFTIVSAPGGVSGTFTATNLPALGGGNEWRVDYQASAVILSVTNTGTPPPTGYDLYAQQITNAADRGLQADADGDGYANLLEYVTGGDPTNADQVARLSGVTTNGLLVLLFTRATNSADATLHVEGSPASTNDAVWTDIAINSNGLWTGAATVTETGGPTPVSVSVQDTDPAATNRFLRLRVTRP